MFVYFNTKYGSRDINNSGRCFTATGKRFTTKSQDQKKGVIICSNYQTYPVLRNLSILFLQYYNLLQTNQWKRIREK